MSPRTRLRGDTAATSSPLRRGWWPLSLWARAGLASVLAWQALALSVLAPVQAQSPAPSPPAAPAAALAAVVEEVPFITTPDSVTLAMLQLAQVGPQDRLIDLGSGDGRIVITAAKRFGAQGLGVDIDPQLVSLSLDHARQAGVSDRVAFREQDLFKTDLAQATVITMYLLPEVNLQLRPRLLALAPGTRIVSHDWDMADWAPDRSLTLDVPDKAIGREKKSRVHLWVVPAPVQGRWCGAEGRALQLAQQFQQVQGQALLAGEAVQLWGRADGANLHLAARSGNLQLAWRTGGLQVEAASGRWAGWRGQRLLPAASATAGCPA